MGPRSPTIARTGIPAPRAGTKADLGVEVAGVGGDRAQRLGDGPEEEAVENGLVVGGDRCGRSGTRLVGSGPAAPAFRGARGSP